jgi:integrase
MMKDLTLKQVAALRAPGKHRVSKCCYLQVTETGARSWLFRYQRHGRAHWHGLGGCDLVSLAEARDLTIDRRKMLRAGIDPIEHARARRQQALVATAVTMTFRQCAERYIASHKAGWRSAVHHHQWVSSLAAYAFPIIGDLPVHAIDVSLVLRVLEPIWREKTETATRVRNRVELILDWARARGYRPKDSPNPARWRGHLDKLLPKPTNLRLVQHLAAMSYVEVPDFAASLRGRPGVPARALEFLILTAARPGEGLGATWAEIDLDNRVWTVPAGRMKGHREHRVPLSDRAVELLTLLPREAGNDRVFLSPRRGKALSQSWVLRVMKGMGVEGTPHGFRSSFRDWCAEMTGFPSELAEMSLAHAIKGKAEAAYFRSDVMAKRRRLMDAWARYVTSPAPAKSEVVPMARRA